MNVVAGIGGKERIEEDDILPQINLNVGTANVRDNVRDRIKELRRQEEYLQLGASGEHEKFRTDRDSSSRHKQDVVLSHSDVNKTLWQSQSKQSFKGLSSKTISSDVTQPPDTDEVTQVESQPIVRVPRLYKSQLVTGCSDLPTNNSTDHTTNQLVSTAVSIDLAREQISSGGHVQHFQPIKLLRAPNLDVHATSAPTCYRSRSNRTAVLCAASCIYSHMGIM